MRKLGEKQKAIDLRKEGLSYREIREQVPVAKATLSLWLRSVGLSTPQKQRLSETKLAAGRRGAEKLRRERIERVRGTMAAAEEEAKYLITGRDWLWLAGTTLYWAEGSKAKTWRTARRVEFTNTDHRMILLIREWLNRCCSVPAADMCYDLYIHQSANVDGAVAFWESKLDLAPGQLRIYFKKINPRPRRWNTGEAYHGTIRLRVCRSTSLNDRIAGWVNGLASYCGVV